MLSPQTDENKYTYMFAHVYALDTFKCVAQYSKVRSSVIGFVKSFLSEISALHPRDYIVISFSPIPLDSEAAKLSFETYRKEKVK